MKKESVIGKALLRGKLELCSPLLIGSGGQRDGNDVDTQVLLDKERRPFIPGTSVAGVLRAALPAEKENVFFGGKVDALGGAEVQSAVNIDDIELPDARITLRDGVCIDDERGVAAEEKKFDYEMVERGATGDFLAEITLRGYHRDALGDVEKAIRELAESIAAGFRLGAMTAKGFGRVRIRTLSVDYYDFQKTADAAAWLSEPRGRAAATYDVTEADVKDNTPTESSLIVDADFALVGSLIVKDTEVPPEKKKGDSPIHAVMKKSGDEYLIPGPSVKGALRHSAARILEQVGIRDTRSFLNKLMGLDDAAMKEAKKRKDKTTVRQSRFLVDEVYIGAEEAKPFAQTRNRIDRFTGGTIGGALFTTEAVWGNGEKLPIHIHFEIRGEAEDSEIGLALLLLRELSLGRIPLGGEKSIGRGVLMGKRAKIRCKRKNGEEFAAVIENGKLVDGGAAGKLQECADALANMAEVTV